MAGARTRSGRGGLPRKWGRSWEEGGLSVTQDLFTRREGYPYATVTPSKRVKVSNMVYKQFHREGCPITLVKLSVLLTCFVMRDILRNVQDLK